jgi:predicted protein tyrosine phosphatase
MTDTLVTPLLPYDITICGLRELCRHADRGVTHVVSILDPEHPDPEDFATYGPHSRELWRFDDVVLEVEGAILPGEREVEAVLAFGRRLKEEKVDHLLIHCHAGVSRSTATAIILMVQDNPGRETDAFAELTRIRPQSWPNSRMIGLADAMLGRGGALSEALREHHARVRQEYPELARMIAQYGRAHEVPDLDRLLKS